MLCLLQLASRSTGISAQSHELLGCDIATLGLFPARLTLFQREVHPMATDVRSIRFHAILWSLVAYGLSLVLPALREPRGAQGADNDIYGIQCLILVPFVMLYPAWYANWLFFIGLGIFVRKRYVAAFWCGLISILLALTTVGLFSAQLQRWLDRRDKAVFPLGPGYFSWLLSMVILTVGARWQMPRSAAQRPPAPPSSP